MLLERSLRVARYRKRRPQRQEGTPTGAHSPTTTDERLDLYRFRGGADQSTGFGVAARRRPRIARTVEYAAAASVAYRHMVMTIDGSPMVCACGYTSIVGARPPATKQPNAIMALAGESTPVVISVT